MPPKDTPKKPPPQIPRPSISDSSLVYVPDDVLEGFQERIEAGIDWTLVEQAARHHKALGRREKIPEAKFSEAFQKKIDNSILGGFLNQDSNISIEQQWELLLPITLWDNEKFANKEGKVCFQNNNCLTDDMVKLIKRAVYLGDRNILKRDIKMVNVLRVNDCQMTDIDEQLKEFEKLVSLNLCGNFLLSFDATMVPPSLRSLELQANRIKSVDDFARHLPHELLYIGLSRNDINNDSVAGLSQLPSLITVLDLSDNDIYHLQPLLDALVHLQNLSSLLLAGNPCAVCAAYARYTISRLQGLKWLDSREILPSDRSEESFEPHPDDLRSTYFNFTVYRVMSTIQPPKPEKGCITTFHVELEIPLLDAERRQFLMFRRYESLIEMLPPSEDDEWPANMSNQHSSFITSKLQVEEASSHEFDVYKALTAKNSREICNFKTFESNRVQWNKIMNFQEPTVRIFCPDLTALRDTFRSVITIRLVYSVTASNPVKSGKTSKKSVLTLKAMAEQRVVLATMRCALRRPDWSQSAQHFHWDDSLGTNDAIHWGDGDLSILQYTQTAVKPVKSGKYESEIGSSKQSPPDNLTCHFGFGIDSLRP